MFGKMVRRSFNAILFAHFAIFEAKSFARYRQ
jgi:hypothetical protein